MARSITLAAVHGAGLPTPLVVVLVVAGVGYVLWRRMQGEPLQAKRLLVLPLVFSVLGVVDLTESMAPHLGPADIAVLMAGAVISAVLGAARGATIELFPREGHLWQRYRGVTVALWGVLIASKLVLASVAHLVGAKGATGTASLMFSLGVSLLGEAAMVAARALSTGVSFAPDRSHTSRTRPSRARADRFANLEPDGRSSPSPAWDNGANLQTPSRQQGQHNAQGWRSPGWRDGVERVRSHIEQLGGKDW
jgi:FtsH-binding integral membrane protein